MNIFDFNCYFISQYGLKKNECVLGLGWRSDNLQEWIQNIFNGSLIHTTQKGSKCYRISNQMERKFMVMITIPVPQPPWIRPCKTILPIQAEKRGLLDIYLAIAGTYTAN